MAMNNSAGGTVTPKTPVPLLTCPDCGYSYPPGSAVTDEGALDSLVESGGRSSHPSECPRSEAPRESSIGVFQQQLSPWRR